MEYKYENPNEPKDIYPKHVTGKAAVLGVIVILAGLLLLARNTGFLDATVSRVIFSWEMLLIVIGVVNIFWRQSLVSGIILIGVGCFFLLVNFYHMPFNTWQIFLPALIILIGLKMIFGGTRWPNQWHDRRHENWHDHRMFSQTVGSDDFFEDIAVFSGGDRKIVTPNFKGGRMVAIFGGSKVDLLNSNIAPGDRPVIEIVSIFGGNTIIMPSDWNVKLEVFNIFGGYSDKRNTSQIDYNKTLVIKGVTIFGGGEVKSY